MMLRLHLSLLTPVAALCAGLAACDAVADTVTARQVPIDIVAPLLADDGSAYPPAQRLAAAEATAGGPAPGWATRAQRDQLQRLHPGRVVRLHAAGRDTAVPRTPAPDAWVFVDGNSEGAVRLARRIVAAGVERVWVVLPNRTAPRAPSADHARRSQP